MKIINLPRAAGKTTKAVKMSAELNIPILCASKSYAYVVCDRAQEFDLQVKTITISELQNMKELPDSVIIDELDFVLAQLLNQITGKTIGVTMATISDDENSHLTCIYKK